MAKSEKAAEHVAPPLERLEAARAERESAELAERDAVAAARAAGISWARIGQLYGLTKQGAQQRFKPAVKQVQKDTLDPLAG